MQEFMIGQRVIIPAANHGSEKEIGVVTPPLSQYVEKDRIWVRSPTRGHALWFDLANVEPLPNGQL
jgi:hypothetical protein